MSCTLIKCLSIHHLITSAMFCLVISLPCWDLLAYTTFSTCQIIIIGSIKLPDSIKSEWFQPFVLVLEHSETNNAQTTGHIISFIIHLKYYRPPNLRHRSLCLSLGIVFRLSRTVLPSRRL